MSNRERIIELVRIIRRPGVDSVLDYLNQSTYFTCGCYEHHTEKGGLAQHSLEVYEYMRNHSGGLPAESLVVAALFHDLGKTCESDGREHGARSLDILKACGFELNQNEDIAIGKHHDKAAIGDMFLKSFLGPSPILLVLLSMCDMKSAGQWKNEHPNGI